MLRASMESLNRVADLLYPPACLRCHQHLRSRRSVFCVACLTSMPRTGRPICQRCGMMVSGAFDATDTCVGCRRRALAFEAARSPWVYTGPLRDALHLFKYRDHWRIGDWLADEMSVYAAETLPLERIDLVLPVPLHWLKRVLRGYNPAAELAQRIARELDLPYAPQSLRRRRWTATQTTLHGRRRFRNVQDAFAANPRHVNGKRILLIDDVLTSGATAHACAGALRDAGARDVFVLTAARTPAS